MSEEINWIDFDPSDKTPADRQFLLSQLVVPRPIAMVSTIGEDGVLNIAPMSYFLPITGSPMLVGVTMGLREDGDPKHTYLNALHTGDFVINITTENLSEEIETVAIESPRSVDEYELANWTPSESVKIKAPGITEARARLECEIREVVKLGEAGIPFGEVNFVVAEVVWATYSEEIVNDRGRIDPLLLEPIGRLGLRSFISAGGKGIFSLERIPWSQYQGGSNSN
ncbi:MAG: flavin reductase family protein [Acidimicrobiales bacterium]|nr:flavin reductase family protein [Acidimicrobiales bacterium]